MFTIDLNKPIMVPNFEKRGSDESEKHLCVAMCEMLANSPSPKGYGMKCNDWVFDLAESGTIVCDDSDYHWLLDFIDANQATGALAKGQLIKAFKSAKSDAS